MITPQIMSINYKKQLIISLGESRTLTIGSKEYNMENGDVEIFGSSYHSVPKNPEITKGRISIAVFINNGLVKQ